MISRYNYCMRLLCCLLTVFTLVSTVDAQAPQSVRRKLNFNPGWKLYDGDTTGAEKPSFNDQKWRDIGLPHAFNEDDAFRVDIHNLRTGIAWYRKHFKIPQQYKGNKIFIEFEGIRQAGEVYLNGKLIGSSENGVMAFGFDLTDGLKFGNEENVIAVRVDNSWDYKEKATGTPYQWNNNNFYANYGGINKNVFLHVASPLYQTLPLYSNLKTTGTYIYATDFDIAGKSAKITAETQVKNDYATPRTFRYEVRIADATGKIIKTINGGSVTLSAGETKTISASAIVNNLNFWSWGYGYLYDVYTVLKTGTLNLDVVKTRTGFRKTEFTNGLIKLNDRVMQVHGYAQRTTNEWPAVGSAVPAWMSDLSNGLIVEGNGNLVRWMHVTPWKQDIESLDRMGLLHAMPAADSEGDPTGRRWEHRVEVMRDAVIYNRNNPSIIFYEAGNKGVREEHMKDMRDVRDQYDPHGGRASGSREMLDSKIAEYGGEMLYINKSARIPMWQMEYCRDEGLRGYWDELSPPYHKNGDGPKRKEAPRAYNHNMDSFALEDIARWFDYWEQRPGTGIRVNSGGVNIVFSDSNTHFRGEENYRTSGEVDAMRIPKDAYFAHQVMWDGWVDPANNRSYIIGHWNYKDGIKKDVYVVSSGEKVQLFVNGKSKGYGQRSKNFLFTFNAVAWEPGVIKAISYDKDGKQLSVAQKKTAGEPAKIKLTLHTGPGGLKADGADLALIDVEVVDAQGQRCPIARNSLNFTLTGAAEWRGGIAHGLAGNGILSKTLPVVAGINRVIIRSTAKAGSIVLKAEAAGLPDASITLMSKPFIAQGGLAYALPADGLKPSLKRGPTPAGASYKVSRMPITVKSVTAGSNQDAAQKSIDDIENSAWANDGTLANGWIKYHFDGPHAVNEVTIKLTGWRSRRYPISILVDDKEVFNGVTPQSLGYICLPFKQVSGSSLTVKLSGTAAEKDAFGLVEVSGKKDDPGSIAPDEKGRSTLGINEIEIYQNLNQDK